MPIDLLSPTACRCEQCSSDPLPTYTEKFRNECEARYVARIKGLDTHTRNRRRSEYLHDVLVARGRAAYKKLRQEVWVQMNALGITP